MKKKNVLNLIKYYIENNDITFNEIDVFREILKTDKNMFTFFANSFLIEITKGECDKTYKYISFNNIRKEKYRLITKIADEYVEKQEVNEKAHKHYENIKSNIRYLNEKGIKTVDYIENQIIRSKYIEQKNLLNNRLTELLEEQRNDEFYEILDKFIEKISIDTYHEKDYDKTAFGKYGIEVQDKGIINDLHFTPKGLWDMTLKNCFYIENDFYFFDQEWNEPNLPVEYILYRSILYTISLRRFIKIEDLLEKYNLTKYLELFKKLDDKMQEMVRDDETWKSYRQNNIIDIDATKQELINQNIRNMAQKQEIENLNIRSNAQKAEADNLKEQIRNLTEENKKMFMIPKGFAHGFLVLSEEAEFTYKCDDIYNHEAEGGLKFDDPDVGIEWPMGDLKKEDLITSEKDAKWPSLQELKQTDLFKNIKGEN